MKRYMKRSSLWGDLQSVKSMSSMILYLSVYLPAHFIAISKIFRFLIARILTPYFLVIRL